MYDILIKHLEESDRFPKHVCMQVSGLDNSVALPSFIIKNFRCQGINRGSRSGFRITFVFDKKEKKFISHLTIGRVKSPKSKKEIRNAIEKLEDIEIGQMTVSKLCLKKSTLTPQGPIYEDIKVFEL